ncbi:MAG: dephospho-CoA kinase [Opitutales bacterium]
MASQTASEDIPTHWALTGSMGAGKSTVLQMFSDAGWLTLDSDQIVRGLLTEDPEILQKISERWGPGVLSEDGSANRPEIGKIVFKDPNELRWLEDQLHPRVRQRWMDFLQTAGTVPVIVEIPLLFEKNLEPHFSQTVCLSISPDLQLERLAKRGMASDTARDRLARQLPTSEKVKRADKVICNDGSLAFLRAQVEALLRPFSN